MPTIGSSECVYFNLTSEGKIADTRKAYSRETKDYTITISGEYVFIKKGTFLKAKLTAGDILRNVDTVMGEHCGAFYRILEREAGG